MPTTRSKTQPSNNVSGAPQEAAPLPPVRDDSLYALTFRRGRALRSPASGLVTSSNSRLLTHYHERPLLTKQELVALLDEALALSVFDIEDDEPLLD